MLLMIPYWNNPQDKILLEIIVQLESGSKTGIRKH